MDLWISERALKDFEMDLRMGTFEILDCDALQQPVDAISIRKGI